MPRQRCIRCGNRVPWYSFWGNATLTVYKIVVGIFGGSSALIADGIHSFTDVIGTSVILFSRSVSRRPEDPEHPYGHGKVEFLSSAFIYIVLTGISVMIFVGALLVLLGGEMSAPRMVTLLAAGISVFYNVLMYCFGQCAGTKNNSPALLANSFENRADAISSIAVILGIAAAVFVHPIWDPIAAMAVGAIIFVNCIVQLRESLAGLMDEALPVEVIEAIEEVAQAQWGVTGVDYVKTRQTGTRYWVDIGIQVPGDLDVIQSQQIATAVRSELLRRSERFHAVEVYVAPEPVQACNARWVPEH